MVLVWSVLVTLILVFYFFLSLALYLEERNHARRQQQLVEAWRIANPWSPPPELEQRRDIERSPLVHDFDDEDGDTSEEEERGVRQGDSSGYGTTDMHPPFSPARAHDDDEELEYYHGVGGTTNNPSPPYSPRTPDYSSIIPTETLIELADNESQVAEATSPPSPSERDRVDSSGVTAGGTNWAHLESARSNGDGDSNGRAQAVAAAEAIPVNSHADQLPLRTLGDEAGSSSSSSHSPRVLDGHELVTKIKKAVHWPPGLNSGSSSSSSSSSPKASSQQGDHRRGCARGVVMSKVRLCI
ncbi:hypothetical protein PG997_009948 [Apiospora hydei]|uniref:Uncharacterized protein n=1 Tax=Apiospora hydei TaxID=1337664 RepID=A0ABR1VVK8_9PEZI